MIAATPRTRQLGAEFIGSAFLLATVIGSGIMAAKLSGGNDALALLGNTLPTGAILIVLVMMLAPISGAHFNPAVTVAFRLRDEIGTRQAFSYIIAQLAGAIAGVLAAHLMFDLPVLQLSAKMRTGTGQWFAEFVATFGLLTTILLTRKSRPDFVAIAAGLYITAAYWFTSSTSFANPAVTIARALSDTFAGIRAQDVPFFLIAQFAGAFAALGFCDWLLASPRTRAAGTENAAEPR